MTTDAPAPVHDDAPAAPAGESAPATDAPAADIVTTAAAAAAAVAAAESEFDTPEGFENLEGSGLVKKRVIKEGEGETMSRLGTMVTVHYTGMVFPSRKKFDSSLDRGEPFQFKLGEGMVIKGWDVGISSMRIGEQAELLISHEYAYGTRGLPPAIPPRSTLLFSVELVAADLSTAERTVPERIAAATVNKNQGNEFFKKGNYVGARYSYRGGLDMLHSTWGATPDQTAELDRLRVVLNINLAAVHLKNKSFADAVLCCEAAREIEPRNAKAIYRLAQGLAGQSLFDRAIEVLDEHRDVLADVDVDAEIQRFTRGKAETANSEKKMYARMFQ